MFSQNEADELTAKVVSRLGNRQQKLEQIQQWEKQSSKKRPIYWVTAIAACIAVVLLIVPLWTSPTSPLDDLNIATPTTSAFRSATAEQTEIATLIEKKEYEKALVKTEKALRQSDLSIKELGGTGAIWNDEELMYEEEAEMMMNSELRWTYIYILVRMERNQEAKKQLKKYIKNAQYGDHTEEAKALLQSLN